jgi:hypothetical protein
MLGLDFLMLPTEHINAYTLLWFLHVTTQIIYNHNHHFIGQIFLTINLPILAFLFSTAFLCHIPLSYWQRLMS